MGRYDLLRQIRALDPERDYVRIYAITSSFEFPWDTTQALSFALFRTYGVPSIGGLLHRTGEFTERTQKRYDDTTLILDAVLEHGMSGADGRAAIRRMNQMHGAYGISNSDLRYVLATFVVCPIRWIDAYGWRKLVEPEKIAMANYYREIGRHMGIKQIPETYQEFTTLLDEYERENFGFDSGARVVADSTLNLLTTFWPFWLLPKPVVRQISYGLMDEPLLDAFHFPKPAKLTRFLARNGLRARSFYVRLTPPRKRPNRARDSANMRSYPGGYRIPELGTFPCQAEPAQERRPRLDEGSGAG